MNRATDIRLSIGILVHDEAEELDRLLSAIGAYTAPWLEVVIVEDTATPEVRAVLETHRSSVVHAVHSRKLDKNFADQRNFLKGKCRGRYILMLDADELPPGHVMANMARLLDFMDANALEVVALPRINLLTGGDLNSLPPRYPVDERGWVGFPEYQNRLFRNDPALRWVNRVHERLIGYKRRMLLPAEEAYALLHRKDFDDFVRSNSYYDRIQLRFYDKWRKIFLKKIGLLTNEVVDLPAPF